MPRGRQVAFAFLECLATGRIIVIYVKERKIKTQRKGEEIMFPSLFPVKIALEYNPRDTMSHYNETPACLVRSG